MTQKHKIYICERSSAHISYQNDLLINEYKEQNNNKGTPIRNRRGRIIGYK